MGAFLSLFSVYFKESIERYIRLGILRLFELFVSWILISLRTQLSIILISMIMLI